jgi:hypothetical protein
MNVYEFSFDVEYGGGVMLVAANSRDEAQDFVSKREKCVSGFWVWSADRPDLTSTSTEPKVILGYTHFE